VRYVIAYDISDDSRRRRIADSLSAFGDRVQYSVFEIDTERADLCALTDSLHDLVHAFADSVRIYRICSACRSASHVIGSSAVRDAPIAWIV